MIASLIDRNLLLTQNSLGSRHDKPEARIRAGAPYREAPACTAKFDNKKNRCDAHFIEPPNTFQNFKLILPHALLKKTHFKR